MATTTTFKEKLASKVKEAQKAQNKAHNKALEKLLTNASFVEAQRTVTAKEEELTRINAMTTQLNEITPFVANDGRKFSINVFAINVFGTGLGSVMGIIQGSRSAFVDEKMLEYSAITGISTLELQEAQMAMGSPAFYKDGKVNDAIDGNYGKLQSVLQGIFIKLELAEFKAEDITKDKFDLWFALAETKANKQFVEHIDLQSLETEASDFILEA